MMNILIIIGWLGFGVGFVRAQTETYVDCRNIPNTPYDFSAMAAASPFFLLRSSNPAENCTVGLLTGPGPFGGSTEYSFLLIREDRVIYSSFSDSAASQANCHEVTTCHAGTKLSYKLLPYDLTCDDPYYVIYLCDENTGKILVVRGYGHNQETGCTIDGVVDQYLSKIPGGGGVADMWANCPTTPYCDGFFN